MKSVSQQRTAHAAVLLAVTRGLRSILGMAVRLLVAFFFGASRRTDSFFVAQTIPENLFGWLGPVLKVSVIPSLAEIRLRRGAEAARQAAGDLLGASLPFYLLGAAVFYLGASPLMRFLAPGFDTGAHAQTVELARLLAPAVLLAGFAELAEAVLNSSRHFTRPAVSRLFAKLGTIAGLLILVGHYRMGIEGVVIGMVVGRVAQLLPQLPLLTRVAPGFWRPRWRLPPELAPILTLLGPAMLWLAIDQVKVWVDQMFASTLKSAGQLSSLQYAIGILQFAVSTVVTSIISASLPALSDHAARGNRPEAARLLGVNLRVILFIALPSIAGLVILHRPLVAALFERGSFGEAQTGDTAIALLFYALGMASISVNMVCRVALFTGRRVGIVLKLGVVEIGVNAVLNAVLMRVMGHEGLALATSLSAAVMGVFLVRAVQREFGQVLTSEVGRSLGKALAATAAMAAVVILVRQGVGADSFARLPGGRVAGVLLCVLAGALSYATACVLLRIEELGRVREVWQRRRNSGS